MKQETLNIVSNTVMCLQTSVGHLQNSVSGIGLTITSVTIICVTIWVVMAYIRNKDLHDKDSLKKKHGANFPQAFTSTPVTESQERLDNALKKVLPESVFFSSHNSFKESVKSYWAMQQREIEPRGIVKPRSPEEVALAVTTIKREYDICRSAKVEYSRITNEEFPAYAFAVRSGGHNPTPGAANSHKGIVLDLRLLNGVQVSDDGTQVVIGTGARWGDVSRVLDKRGLAVAGGRNSSVGVGGLTLGGGLSYFSPRVGFVCNNVISYEAVLADGSLVTASSSVKRRLWRALRGGSNNFGIVTSFTMRTFPSKDIWGGFLYFFPWKSTQVIRAFHNFCTTATGAYDEYAAGPLVCFVYIQSIRVQIIATNLVYTKAVKWPKCFEEFKDIGRIWSSVKIQSLTSATDEVDKSSPAGSRQLHLTTTVQADYDTLMHAHGAYQRGIKRINKVTGMVWTILFQPIHPKMVIKGEGDEDSLGLRARVTEPLVIIVFSIVWKKSSDDGLVRQAAKDTLNSVNEYATEKGTWDEYIYLNDSTTWQKPFDGYGEANKQFLQDVSKDYDPDGLFQRACSGGFKLFVD